MRLEVYSRPPEEDARIRTVLHRLGKVVDVRRALVADVFLWSGWKSLEPPAVARLLSDPVAQMCSLVPAAGQLLPTWSLSLEIGYKAGVTDPVALTAQEALDMAGGHDPQGRVSPAVLYLLELDHAPTQEQARTIASQFHNPLIQEARVLIRNASEATCSEPGWTRDPHPPLVFHKPETSIVRLTDLADSELEALSAERLLALDLEEMRVIRDYYRKPIVRELRLSRRLSPEPTDVELEMLAQTWSEHCKHKIFRAEIDYEDRETGRKEFISSLFQTYIKATTDQLASERPFLKSVFTDNSGVIDMDGETLVCFKVETHNSPSALDPYGGAITGIVGVNRDILGTGLGAKPIWNTNVLCFGAPDTPTEKVPPGLLSPSRVLEGVHKGIVDGGNHSGIPTVAGAFLFDDSYLGKPLVFCGTGGLLPAQVGGRPSWEKKVTPGSWAVMAGGRIGKDGIHGATFSSLALQESSPTSAVQIGDPIIQKVLTDFLLEARDLGLYESLTDNGAGGLSSSLGEMARESGGLRVRLDACPLKYPGLAAWEVWVSESQERMSFSVPPDLWEGFSELAQRRGVEATVVGTFTDTGLVELYDKDDLVGLMDMDFLHEGLPRMRLEAVWVPPAVVRKPLPPIDARRLLLDILKDPNVGSKESLIRQYDHEVQGRSLVKPLTGLWCDAPSDGGALKLVPGGTYGLSVTHGVCPRVGDSDTWAMAACAVDEAFRAHIALGGDPDHAAVLDNFCWPDPVQGPKTPDGRYKLAQLVRACQGLQEACLAYKLPLISGKDSMKNDAWSQGKKISVRPTLLISLVGKIPRADLAPDTDLLGESSLLFLLGASRADFAGSMAEKVLGLMLAGTPSPRPKEALPLYRAVHRAILSGTLESIHDLSDGGLAVALVESCLGGRLGAQLELDAAADAGGITAEELLFGESPSRFLVSVKPENEAAFLELFTGRDVFLLGTATLEETMTASYRGKTILEVPLAEAEAHWKFWSREWA